MSWRRLFGRRAAARDRADEMRAHEDLYVEELIARGRSPETARREARLAFGNARVKLEEIADMNSLPLIEVLMRDARYALRVMRRSPGFTATAVLTLGLGLGGSAAVFSLLDRVVLQPLPYPEPARLVRVQNRVPGVNPDAVWNVSAAQYVYFDDHATSLAQIGVYRGGGGNVVMPLGPQRVQSVGVTASVLPLIGARVQTGRAITAADDTPSAPQVALISDGFWRRVLGADPAVAGTTISFNDAPVEIIGVLESGVELPGWPASAEPELWFPLRINRNGPFWNNHVYTAMAQLAPGASPVSVEQELAGLSGRLIEAFPNAYSQGFFDRYRFRTEVLPLRDAVIGDLSKNLWIVSAGIWLVLLIAGANVANLFLVRMDVRRRELGLRAALGAGRFVLARQVFVEGVVLAAFGGACALLLAYWGVPALAAMAPEHLARIHGAAMDGRTVLFTIALAFLVGVAMAAYPALLQARSSSETMQDNGRAASSGRRSERVRAALVVVQVALALALVLSAGLVIASITRLRNVNIGVNVEGVLTVDLYLSPKRHATDEAVWRVYSDVLQRVRAIPGVVAAGMSSELPVRGGFGCTVQGFEDAAVFARIKDAGLTTCSGQEPTTPGYFAAMGIPVVAGRDFVDADNDDPARAAVIVSKAFADRFWPGENPIGKGVAPNGRTTGPFHRVVGVVGDVLKSANDGAPPLSQTAIAVYYPMRRDPSANWNSGWWPGYMTLAIKTTVADPTTVFPTVRDAIRRVDPTIPLGRVATMDDIVSSAVAQLAFVSVLLEAAALVALLLAAVGIYGVISYVVARRTREIGIRVAIGAARQDVLALVVTRSMTLVVVGMVAGAVLSVGSARAMQSFIVGLTPPGPGVYAAAAGILAAIGLAACCLPAWRASRTNPVQALRAE